MNPFVNPKKRDVTLPVGCKDLMDVLEQETAGFDFKTSVVEYDFKTNITEAGFIIAALLPGLRSSNLDITIEGNTVRIKGKGGNQHALFETVIQVPSGHNLSAAHAAYLSGELRIVIPKSAV